MIRMCNGKGGLRKWGRGEGVLALLNPDAPNEQRVRASINLIAKFRKVVNPPPDKNIPEGEPSFQDS